MNTTPLFSSMHTHTTFCDGKDDIETMCRAAYEANLFAIGFSAHAPIEKQTGSSNECNLKDERVSEYVAEVLAAKERWQGKIKVFLGYEADYIKGIRSPLDNDITSLNLDYVIGSVHYLFPGNSGKSFIVDGSKEEFDTGLKEFFNGDAQKFMHSYYDAIIEMIEAGGFDILGHADVFKKNCQDKTYWPKETEESRQRETAQALAKAHAKTGMIIEINTGGINRNKINDTYPSLSFLRIIKEYDIPVIITADAHRASQINGNYDFALKAIILADIKNHFLFDGRKNGKAVWIKEKV